MIKFSIILPTFNREKLLKKAIDSVINQSYSHWELVIVNDGSTDNTKAYLDAIVDNRIIVYHCINKGQGLATNFGLDQATGDYICFLDDDDFIDCRYLKDFYDNIDLDNPEILRTGFKMILSNGAIKYSKLYSSTEFDNPLEFIMHYMAGVWSLAIPVQFMEGLRFVNRSNWLDTYFMLQLFVKYPLKQIHRYTYNYRIHSIMGSQKFLSENGLASKAEDNVEIIREFFREYPEIEEQFLAKNTVKKAIAKKYAEYATTALRQKHYTLAQEFIQKSYQEIWHSSLWKQYLMYYLVKMGLR